MIRKVTGIPESDHRPIRRYGSRFQRLIWIYGNGSLHHFEQWEIIVRVTIEPTPSQCSARLFEPSCETDYLAPLKAGGADVIAGVAISADFGEGGYEMIDAIKSSNRGGNEGVCGRNDHQRMS